ncbi:MAG: hypothetical protein ACF8R7_03990 [Phycisphaerales bacterium JB039]
MNRYRVSVADKATGQVSHTIVEATTEDGARERAAEQGQGEWLVGEVKFESVVAPQRRGGRPGRRIGGRRRPRPISIAAAVALAIIAIVVAFAIAAQLL